MIAGLPFGSQDLTKVNKPSVSPHSQHPFPNQSIQRSIETNFVS